MSTPSEQNPEPVELSDYLPRQLREQASSPAEDPVASESDPPRSPYAPKPAAERAAARLRLLAAGQNDEPPQPVPSEVRRRIISDQELARIEAALRQLQPRQSAGLRLPHGPNLPLPGHSGTGAAGAAGEGDGERVLEWLARPRSLEPTIMPPPPVAPARKLHAALLVAVAFFAGAAAFYAFLPARSVLSAANTAPDDPEIASVTVVAPSSREHTGYSQASSRSAALSPAASQWQESISPESVSPKSASPSAGTPIELARIETSQASAPSPAEVISVRSALAKAEPGDEENMASSPPRSAVPALQPEDIDVLIAQGERFMNDGDIVTARMIFERAAKANNATAALALAAAYDPIVLSKLGALGVDTDVEKARWWYQKAQSLGSAQAVERLRALAER
ncbi:MAG TPA: hypothetical protein VH678_26175 [Xanthobacteraceae bacterium]|jgi:hypothetical protein